MIQQDVQVSCLADGGPSTCTGVIPMSLGHSPICESFAGICGALCGMQIQLMIPQYSGSPDQAGACPDIIV